MQSFFFINPKFQASVVVQLGLCLTLPEIQKAGFLATRLIMFIVRSNTTAPPLYALRMDNIAFEYFLKKHSPEYTLYVFNLYFQEFEKC